MKIILVQICNTFKAYKKTISVILIISLVTAAGSFIHPIVIRNITDEGMMNTYRSLSQGLDTVVGVNGMNLSGGEKQKFAFIQAILSDAQILIFDEATSNYDQETENWFFTSGLDILENKTVIVVTHQYQFLDKFDRAYILKDGSISEFNYRII